MEFDLLGAIVAGLAGTALMTALMYMMPRMGMPKMDMIGMLGTMFSGQEGTATAIGTLVHFMMGALFAIIYVWIWSIVLGAVTWWWGAIFGAVHGIIAVMVMPMMMGMHPRRGEVAMDRSTVLAMGVVVGHIVFGLVVALVYAAFV